MKQDSEQQTDEIVFNTPIYPACVACSLFQVCNGSREWVCAHLTIGCKTFVEWNARLYDTDTVGGTDDTQFMQ